MTFDGSTSVRGPVLDLPPEVEERAVRVVCSYAMDAADARAILEMLDIVPDGR